MESKDSFQEAKLEGKHCDDKGYDDWDDRGKEADSDEEVSSTFWLSSIALRHQTKVIGTAKCPRTCFSPVSLLPVPLRYRCLCQVEAEYRAALNKANVGKVAVSADPQAQSIVEGFRM